MLVIVIVFLAWHARSEMELATVAYSGFIINQDELAAEAYCSRDPDVALWLCINYDEVLDNYAWHSDLPEEDLLMYKTVNLGRISILHSRLGDSAAAQKYVEQAVGVAREHPDAGRWAEMCSTPEGLKNFVALLDERSCAVFEDRENQESDAGEFPGTGSGQNHPSENRLRESVLR